MSETASAADPADIGLLPCAKCDGTGSQLDPRSAGDTMRSARVETDVSMTELARRLGITTTYLADLEAGRRRWTRKLVHQVLGHLAAIRQERAHG